MNNILVSACLLGCKVRYSGDDLKLNSSKFDEFIQANNIIPICPEVAGGLPTPRIPAEICGGTSIDVLSGNAKVIDQEGTDVTQAFIEGAHQALKLCLENDIKLAVLAQSSPSCGSKKVYNGNFERVKVLGTGVTCALLEQHGVKVISQDDFY